MKTILRFSFPLLLILFFLFSPSHSYASDWEQYGFNAQHTGYNLNEISINKSNASTLETAWIADIYGTGSTGFPTSSPAISNGILYITSAQSNDHKLYALNPTTGTQIWSVELDSDFNSSPTVKYGMVYVNDGGQMKAFNASNGSLIWRKLLSFFPPTKFSPTVSDGIVYVSENNSQNGDGSLFSFNAFDGTEMGTFSYPFLRSVSSSPTIGSINLNGELTKVAYFCSGGGYITAVNLNDFSLLWETDTSCSEGTPTFSNGIVYQNANFFGLTAIDGATGEILWHSFNGNANQSIAIANGVVYSGSKAYDALTGELIWISNIGFEAAGSPTVANGVVYLPAFNTDKIFAIDASNGSMLWSFTAYKRISSISYPVIANGMVYFHGNRGDLIVRGPLYAFRLGDTAAPETDLTQTPLANQLGWSNSNVTINLNSTDNSSGVKEIHYEINGDSENIISGTNASFIVSNEGTTIINYWAVDNAGNVEQNKTYYLAIDKALPIINVSSPIEGAIYLLNEPITSNFTAYDSLSGISSVNSTVPNGQIIDTSTVGTHTFSVTATDNAGNTNTKTITYYVHYGFGGFQNPLGSNKVFKSGGTIPVKFQLTDYQGNIISNATVSLYVAKITDDIIGTDESATSTNNADTGNQFRYDSANQIYIYNLSTQSSPLGQPGTYQLKATLSDGSSYTSTISLK